MSVVLETCIFYLKGNTLNDIPLKSWILNRANKWDGGSNWLLTM